MAAATRARETKATAAGAGAKPSQHVPTILLVEDDALIRFFMAEELRAQGWRVVQCSDAGKALRFLQGGAAADLLLTDIRMPGEIDGAVLTHRIRQDYPAMKVVVVTAHLRESELGIEVHGFFRKPVDMPRLAEHVRHLLEPIGERRAAFGSVAAARR